MNHAAFIEEKVFDYIKTNQMLEPGDKVVAGVSGGADSVCLLFVLLKWAERYSLPITVVHVDHGIREDSAEDARFVERLCRENQIKFCLRRVDIRQIAEERGLSEEEAGRWARYQAFSEYGEKYGARKTVVAHNMDDRAETMLFQLFRGSGISGLRSIRPVRDQIIRPLLCLTRQEIESYLKERNIEYRTDSTNNKDDYARNRIRHHILPYAEENIASGCTVRMAQTADMLLETEDYLEKETKKAYTECVVNPFGSSDSHPIRIRVGEFQGLHPAIQKRLLLLLLKELTPEKKDITYRHVGSLSELFEREGNRRICLPHGIRCVREYKEVVLYRRDGIGSAEGNKEQIFAVIEPDRIPTEGLSVMVGEEEWMDFKVLRGEEIPFLWEKQENIPEKRYTKWLDYDKMVKSLVLRTRRVGDYFCIKGSEPGEMSHKKVKDFMIGEKIPVRERNRILLLAQEEHVIWVAGYRISEYYKISKNTKRILQVQLRRGCESSGKDEEPWQSM